MRAASQGFQSSMRHLFQKCGKRLHEGLYAMKMLSLWRMASAMGFQPEFNENFYKDIGGFATTLRPSRRGRRSHGPQ